MKSWVNNELWSLLHRSDNPVRMRWNYWFPNVGARSIHPFSPDPSIHSPLRPLQPSSPPLNVTSREAKASAYRLCNQFPTLLQSSLSSSLDNAKNFYFPIRSTLISQTEFPLGDCINSKTFSGAAVPTIVARGVTNPARSGIWILLMTTASRSSRRRRSAQDPSPGRAPSPVARDLPPVRPRAVLGPPIAAPGRSHRDRPGFLYSPP